MSSCSTCGADAVVQWRRRAAEKDSGTVPVYGCADHALTPAAAGYVHQAECAGPSKGACACPVPAVEFPFDPADDPKHPQKRRLPAGW